MPKYLAEGLSSPMEKLHFLQFVRSVYTICLKWDYRHVYSSYIIYVYVQSCCNYESKQPKKKNPRKKVPSKQIIFQTAKKSMLTNSTLVKLKRGHRRTIYLNELYTWTVTSTAILQTYAMLSTTYILVTCRKTNSWFCLIAIIKKFLRKDTNESWSTTQCPLTPKITCFLIKHFFTKYNTLKDQQRISVRN